MNNTDSKRVLVAMSGGVDSSVAVHVLKRGGYDCVGAMMKLYTDSNIDTTGKNHNKGCCSLEDAEDARAVATALGIPFYVLNFTEHFAAQIMERFVKAYQAGQTPNPCIDCNRFMKAQKLMQRAAELECGYVATGHYARIEKSPSGRYLLKTGLDNTKDQSYVLYAMNQDVLSKTLFPLGELNKDEVREIAENQGFTNAKKRDSQDICFAPDKDYAGFIERYTNTASKQGRFVNRHGKVMGIHKGIIHYTIGQRKGLGISAAEPLYVIGINHEDNTVTLGYSEDLFSKTLTAGDINLIPMDKLENSLKVKAKIRYSQLAAQPATICQLDDSRIHVEFNAPQRAITPGQAVVFYDGDVVVGGGTIE